MNRLAHFAVAASTVIGLAACSSDAKSTGSKGTDAATPTVDATTPEATSPDISIPDISIPDISIPDFSIPDISIPDISIPEMSPECMAFYEEFAAAFTGQGDVSNLPAFFAKLKEIVPAELKDDADLVATTMGTYLELVQKYGNDFTKLMADPEAQKALEALSTPEFEAANNNISDYMDSICPQS